MKKKHPRSKSKRKNRIQKTLCPEDAMRIRAQFHKRVKRSIRKTAHKRQGKAATILPGMEDALLDMALLAMLKQLGIGGRQLLPFLLAAGQNLLKHAPDTQPPPQNVG